MSTSPSITSRRRGGALVLLVMVVAAAVAVVLLYAQTRARQRLQVRTEEVQGAKLHLALTDAMLQALPLLADDEDLAVDHLDEPWAQPIEFVNPDGVSIRVEIHDACSKLDLNNLYVEVPTINQEPFANLVEEVLVRCGAPTPTFHVQALRDWIDPDDDGSREAPHYREQQRPVTPPNRWFQSWDELQYVSGFGPEWLDTRPPVDPVERFDERLRNLTTLLPVSRTRPIKINLNTASHALLWALVGVENEARIDELVAYRKSNPLRKIGQASQLMPEAIHRRLEAYTDVGSAYFEVSGRAFHSGTGVSARALVQREHDGNVEIIQWLP